MAANVYSVFIYNRCKHQFETQNHCRIVLEAGVLFVFAITLMQIDAQSTDLDASNPSRNKFISYYQSALGLSHLIYSDLRIAKMLEDNMQNFSYRSNLRNASLRYLEDLYSGSGFTTEDSFTYSQAVAMANNPIASYRTIRRMITLLHNVTFHAKGILEFPGKDVTEYLISRGFPSQIDLDAATDRILYLTFFTGFDIMQFSEGKVSGVSAGAKLDAVHCYEIGKYALEYRSKYDNAINWLKLALLKLATYGDQTIDVEVVNSLLKKAVKKHDEEFMRTNGAGLFLFSEPIESSNFANQQARKKEGRLSIANEYDKDTIAHDGRVEDSISSINPETKHVPNGDPSTALPKYSYRSVPSLKLLTQTEYQIYKIMKVAFVHSNQNISQMGVENDESLETNNSCVETYINDFEESTGKIIIDDYNKGKTDWEMVVAVENVTSNPITVFRMIWRFEHFVKKWTSNDLVLGRSYHHAIEEIREIYSSYEGPESVDFKEVAIALLKIQYVYDLDASDMATGVVAGRSTGVTLNALHCYSIGQQGIAEKMYTLGIEWLEAALFKIKFSADSSITHNKVVTAVNSAKEEHDVAHAVSEGWEPYFYSDKFSDTNDSNDSVSRVTRKKIQYDYYRFKQEPRFAEINFNGICSGKPHQTLEEKSKLFCWYESEIHPFWKINPIKAEFHSLQPQLEVVQYYDLLSDSIMEKLKGIVIPRLEKSTTVNGVLHDDSTFRSTDSKVRSSVNAWIDEGENEDSRKVTKLIERVTGLVAESHPVDDIQIGSYAPGAHYDIHQDDNTEASGLRTVRIATFMFYFSDVLLGGHTAFCQAGASVAPRKGSAVFWYNYFNSGKPNDATWHGACPVILGEKWVANMWISYNAQKHHVCRDDRSTVEEILVNGKSKYI